MSTRNEDFLFAEEAQALGFITEAQADEGFHLQRRMAEDLQIDERLSVILVKRGWLADEQARRVRARIEPKGPGAEIEGYELLSRLGRGAMGTVYKAKHLRLQRIVAVKILRRDLITDATQTERLRTEAELLASLDHPNIVRALDAGESNGFPYFVMEYVEGENLRDRLARAGPLPEHHALDIARDLADALERARRMGVVHRDVKPGNIILTKQGTPKLMDLGLAKGPIDLGLTQHGATVGTPQFISPEQAQDPRKADTRSDIYSLGATLYAMLVGRPPFEGSTLAEILTKVLYEQPTPIRALRPEVSGEASYLVERMMLKDPSLRHPTPAAVVADLDRLRGGRSIVPQGFTGNWEAWLLRRRMRRYALRGGVAAAVLLLLAGGTFLAAGASVRRKAGKEANERAQRLLSEVATPHFEGPPSVAGTTPEEVLQLLARDIESRREAAAAAWARAREQEDEIAAWEAQAGGPSESRQAVDAGLAHLAATSAELDLLHRTLAEVRQFHGQANRAEPVRAAEAYDIVLSARAGGRIASTLPYMAGAWQSIALQLQAMSERELEVLGRRAEQELAAASDFGELERAARALDGDLEDGRRFIDGPPLVRLRREADAVQRTAVALLSASQAFDEALTVPRLQESLRKGEGIDGLRRTVLAEARLATNAMQRALNATPLEGLARFFIAPAAVLGPTQGLLAMQQSDLERRVDATARAWFRERRAIAEDLLRPGQADAEAADREAQVLRAFAQHSRVYGAELGREADALAVRLENMLDLRLRNHEETFARVQGEVFAAIRRGDHSVIEAALARALKEREPALDRDDRIAMLAPLARAAATLESLALEGLQTRLADKRPPRGVRLKHVEGGGAIEFERPVVHSIDHARRQIVWQTAGRSAALERLPVSQVHPETLLAWARDLPRAVPPLVEAVARVQALEDAVDAPGVDLRAAIRLHLAAERAIGVLNQPDDVWGAFVAQRLRALEDAQQSREQLAAHAEREASRLRAQGRFVEAGEALAPLLERDGRLRYTQTFELHEQRVLKLDGEIAEGLARDGLRRLLPGARIDPRPDGSHDIVFDFDTPSVQARNFLHALGQFVPEGDARVTTPDETSTAWAFLHLGGETGPVFDRPLSFPQFFDPGKAFALELDLQVLDEAPLVAFDLDGAKVAIASADPRALGLELLPGTPPLERERKSGPPRWFVAGLGRGVGFQTTPLTSYGSSFQEGWSWPAQAPASAVERWEGLSEAERAAPSRRHFAFQPGRRYRVRVQREVDRLSLFVDGALVAEHREARWGDIGTHSDLAPAMRLGTGELAILSFTPILLDDVRLTGTIQRRWKLDREAQLEAEKSR